MKDITSPTLTSWDPHSIQTMSVGEVVWLEGNQAISHCTCKLSQVLLYRFARWPPFMLHL